MSATPYLLLLLLCLSLHVCNGRRLIVTTNKKNEKNLQISDTGHDHPKEISAATMLKTNSSSSKGNEPPQKDSVVETDHQRVAEVTKKVKKDSKLTKQKHATGSRSKSSGSAKKSVTWLVPQNKHREKHPGFNLDYSLPKTHPPSHN